MSNPESTAERANDADDGFVPGSRIGGYKLVAQLASGGMAHVWAAEPDAGSGLGRTVAIKIIRTELAKDKRYAKMFIDEATIASAIEHPNVCQTFELNRHENTLFMVMEWVPGESLGGMLRSGKTFERLPTNIAVRICADACAGLHAAHEATGEDGSPLDVIHRDVSPPNILISLQGQVKVSDFGIAKARHQLHERTKTGEVKGKFGYLAPEQIAGSLGDRRIDIYAMGCVLYVSTLAARPFGNGPQAMAKILKGNYKKPSELDSMYPPGLEDIVVRALQHKAEDRFATADEMRAALEQWLLDAREVVTQSDVANALAARMKPEARAAARKLQLRGRSSAHSFSSLLEAIDDAEPPTAGSGVVVPPMDLMAESLRSRMLSEQKDQEADEDHTVRTEVSPAPARDEDRSGWHKTDSHDLRAVASQTLRTDSGRDDPTLTEATRSSESILPEDHASSAALIGYAALAGVIFITAAWYFIG